MDLPAAEQRAGQRAEPAQRQVLLAAHGLAGVVQDVAEDAAQTARAAGPGTPSERLRQDRTQVAPLRRAAARHPREGIEEPSTAATAAPAAERVAHPVAGRGAHAGLHHGSQQIADVHRCPPFLSTRSSLSIDAAGKG
jgi:cell wall-associated NlpC family hydrolase